MEALLLNEITEAVGGTLGGCDGSKAVRVSGVSTDTRTLSSGDLFVALEGGKFDGHDYAHEAAAKGAAALVLRRDRRKAVEASLAGDDVPVVAVDDTGAALIALGAHCRRKHSATTVVGITGSTGKTTTKDLLAAILSAAGPTIASERSFNNFIGVPLTLLKIDSATRFAVIEIGTNAPGEISALTRISSPHVGIVTNISHSHLEGLKSLRGVAEEKAGLVRGLRSGGTAILNRDDGHFGFLLDAARRGGAERIVTYGIGRRSPSCPNGVDADFAATCVEEGPGTVAFKAGKTRVKLDVMGRHNVSNCMAAIACAAELSVSTADAAEALKDFEPSPMRFEKRRAGDVVIFNDAYNANPASVAAALATFAAYPSGERSGDKPGRKCVVLGDMLELGADEAELHRKAGEDLARGDFALVALVGERAADYARGAREKGVPASRIEIYANTKEALAGIPHRVAPGDLVLVKGSRAMGLEKIVTALEELERGGGRSGRPQCDTGKVC